MCIEEGGDSIRYPNLGAVGGSRQMISTFLGFDHNLRPANGAFYDMKNLTSDHYPVLSPRKKRSLYAETMALGIIGADVLRKKSQNTYPDVALCYADASSGRMIVDGQQTNLSVSRYTHKLLVSMGAYVLVFPDKKYINTLDTTDYGKMEAIWQATGDVTLTPCAFDGSEGSGCFKITATGIGAGFSANDCVSVSGVTATEGINGTAVLRSVAADSLVIEGILQTEVTQPWDEDAPLQVARTVPDMDFVIECGNRLWGCRYGLQGEQIVNEIYCSRLGDFKNWQSFQGLSTDSWVASVGSDGPFTGAVAHLGYPLFFKENCLHKVYISATGAHQIVDTQCRGVQMHCGKSLAVVGETLYYKASSGVMAYDGAFPKLVSANLGSYCYSGNSSHVEPTYNGQLGSAVGGAAGSKYYLSLCDTQGEFHLFVYDTQRDLWHCEDDTQLLHICNIGVALYGVNTMGNILLLTGGGEVDAEETVSWQAVTGDLGLEAPDKKYISRLTLRLSLEPGSQMSVDVQYDHSGIWEPICTLRGDRLGSYPVTLRPRRCDHLRLRLRGEGDMKLYSLTKTMVEGSDRA